MLRLLLTNTSLHIKELINHSILEEKVELYDFECSQSLVNHLETEKLDLLICDIDLANSDLNGFEIAKKLGKMDPSITICLHSNRWITEELKSHMDSNIKTFMPKPMTSGHLEKLILLTLSEIKKSIVYGNVLGSFAVEKYGLDGILKIKIENIAKRVKIYEKMIRF